MSEPSAAFLQHYRKSKPFRDQWGKTSLEMAIAMQVREIRNQRNMTQAQLASASALSVQTIIHVEQGTLALTTKTLRKIAAGLRCALRVEFVSHSDFIKWIFEITTNGIRLVPALEEDKVFIGPSPERSEG